MRKNGNKTSKVIEVIFEPNVENKFQNFYNEGIGNHKNIKENDFEKWNKEQNIRRCIIAIDKKNPDFFNYLYNNAIKNKNDNIITEMYKINCLTPERLEFILEEKNNNIKIPSYLIYNFIKNEKISLLNMIFKYSKFFDNEAVIKFCHFYKYKKPISTSELQNIISNKKYKIDFNNRGDYLCDVCENGHENLVEFLVEHGADVDKNGPLEFACKNGNMNIVKYLVEHRADINNNKSLEVACEKGNENLVKYLIENGANFRKNGPLVAACKYENEYIIKYLVKLGVNVNQVNSDGDTPLIAACKNGNETLVKYLVELGADVNKNGPLAYACKNGNEFIVKYLIDLGADVNQNNGDGDTPLIATCHFLRHSYEHQQFLINFEEDVKTINKAKSEKIQIINKNETIVKYLVEHGANVNQKDGIGNTPLLVTCKNEGLENIVKYLVEHGANVNLKSTVSYEYEIEYTPLIIACEYGHENIVKYLVEQGANINEILKNSKSPLRAACERGKEKIVKYLVEHGADVNIYGPLLSACYQENETMVKYLVEHGADVNYKEYIHYSSYDIPLVVACEKGNENIVKYLVEHGADVNQENYYDDTPLKAACENGNENIINYLKKQGAGKSFLIGKLYRFMNSLGL